MNFNPKLTKSSVNYMKLRAKESGIRMKWDQMKPKSYLNCAKNVEI